MGILKNIVLPKNIFKVRKTTQFKENPVAVLSNEGLEILPAIQQAIDEGDLIILGSGGGSTNLSATHTSDSVTVVSDTGNDALINDATSTQAGVMSATDKVKLDGLSNYVHPNHSGDVVSIGDGITTIQPNTVSNSKLATMPTGHLKGRKTSGTGNVENLTATQVTEMLDVFTDSLKGLVPPSGGATDEFLCADGTFKPPVVNASTQNENGIVGTGVSSDKTRLGGNLNQNTVISGNYTYGFVLNDLAYLTLEADTNTPTTTVKTRLDLTPSLGSGGFLRSDVSGVVSQYAEIRVDPDDTLTGFQRVTNSYKSGVYMPSDRHCYIHATDGITPRSLGVTNEKHYATGMATGTTSKVVYIDDTTGELFKGDSPGTGGTISKYDAGNGVIVTANGTGITFSKTGGVGTFVVPLGIQLISARINGTTSDLAVDNSFSFIIPTTQLDDFPTVTKINRVTGATPTSATPYTYDLDNAPLIQITDSTSSTIKVRVINLNTYTNWALKVNF